MTYAELKAKSETFHQSTVSGAQVKALANRIMLMLINGDEYRGQKAVDRLKYMADRNMFNVHADEHGHGIMVRGTVGNRGTSIAVFIK